jgi:hypothetical protein
MMFRLSPFAAEPFAAIGEQHGQESVLISISLFVDLTSSAPVAGHGALLNAIAECLAAL